MSSPPPWVLRLARHLPANPDGLAMKQSCERSQRTSPISPATIRRLASTTQGMKSWLWADW